MKEMPDRTVFLLVEGWSKPSLNKFDHIELTENPSLKRTPLDSEMQDFLSQHDLLDEYATLVTLMKSEGDQLTERRLCDICFGNDGASGFSSLFESKDVKIFVCKATVNQGHEPSKAFLWLEFSGHSTYVPAQLARRRGDEYGGKPCIIF